MVLSWLGGRRECVTVFVWKVFMHIQIVMATCNGARFLREQLESFAAQDHQDWSLLVSDDHSTDGRCCRNAVSIGIQLGPLIGVQKGPLRRDASWPEAA